LITNIDNYYPYKANTLYGSLTVKVTVKVTGKQVGPEGGGRCGKVTRKVDGKVRETVVEKVADSAVKVPAPVNQSRSKGGLVRRTVVYCVCCLPACCALSSCWPLPWMLLLWSMDTANMRAIVVGAAIITVISTTAMGATTVP